MQHHTVTSVVFVVLASAASAEEILVFTRTNQSFREFDIFARQSDGYRPQDEFCAGEGSTCAEACGSGYEQCASADAAVHCFHPEVGESCCPTATGNSCLADYYCSHGAESETFCCPEGTTLEECAIQFGVDGPLASDVDVADPSASPSESSPVPEPSPEPPTEPFPTLSEIVEITTSVWQYPDETSSVNEDAAESIPYETSTSYPIPEPTAPEEEDDSPGPAPVPTEPSEEGPEEEEGEGGEEEEQSAASAASPAGVALVAGVALAAALF